MTDKDVLDKFGVKPSECSCNTCKNMCMTDPCIPTLEEAHRLVNEGYPNKLNFTILAAPVAINLIGHPVKLMAPKFINNRCVFLDESNLCQLHEKGLKPIEGRFAHHEKPTDLSLFKAILETWL